MGVIRFYECFITCYQDFIVIYLVLLRFINVKAGFIKVLFILFRFYYGLIKVVSGFQIVSLGLLKFY